MSVLAGQPQTSIEPMMLYMGRLAREAAAALALATTETKNAALEAMAGRLEARAEAILEANRNDLSSARGKGRDEAFLDRLMLNEARVAAMATPDVSRGTANMQPSAMGARASSSVRAIIIRKS